MKESRLGLRIPPNMRETLERLAAADGNRSVASLVRQMIEEGIARHYRQLPPAGTDETPDDPTNQMSKHGCGRLVEA